VVTGCNGSQISLHAWIDGCLCYLLTTPHPDRRMDDAGISGGSGGVWKNRSCNLGIKCIISEERFVLELPTSHAVLASEICIF